MIELAEAPLARIVPAALGRILAAELEKVGVRWHFNEAVAAVEAGETKPLRCRTRSGLQVEGDLVLSAIGLRPNTELAATAGLKINRGIVVDALMRTSEPDVYAIGDCAEFQGCVAPFVSPIMHAVEPLARTLAGQPRPVQFPVMPIELKTPCWKNCVAASGSRWRVECGTGYRGSLWGQFHSPELGLCGFALFGAATASMEAWSARLSEGATSTATQESTAVLSSR